MSVSLSVSAEPTGLCFSGNIDSGPNVLQVFLRGKKQQITACMHSAKRTLLPCVGDK